MANSLDEQTSGENHMIGGEGIIVEIDESKFHNPHTNDPHINAQVGWVFGSCGTNPNLSIKSLNSYFIDKNIEK